MQNRIRLAVAALAAAASAAPLGAQAGGRPTTPAPVVVLQHTFTPRSGERVRVRLDGGTTYRLELDAGATRVRLRPVDPGVEPPMLQSVLSTRGAASFRLYTIRPRVSGVYEITTVDGDPLRPLPVTLTRQPSRGPAPAAPPPHRTR